MFGNTILKTKNLKMMILERKNLIKDNSEQGNLNRITSAKEESENKIILNRRNQKKDKSEKDKSEREQI